MTVDEDAKATLDRAAALRSLEERGFVEQVSDREAIASAFAAGMVTFYAGFDPTATSLHVGSLVPIMGMRLLQKHGHRPIVLLGGGTARVGDPSGKSETRRMLDNATIDTNVAAIGRQFARFLDSDPTNPQSAVHLDNTQWLAQLGYLDFLRDIGSHFTVNRMIATKTYRDRLDAEQPLSFLEFNYQLLQAFDFLHLYREHGCTLQLGGNDQWGNIVAGVELIRRMASVHPEDGERQAKQGLAQCLTFPLLTTADGHKMGKTERGAVWLDPDRLSPFDYYQYWINVDDRDVRKLLLLFTDLPLAEVDELCAAEGSALRGAKARLAFESTQILHGEDEAKKATAASQQAFGGGEDWSAVPAIEFDVAEIALVDLAVDTRIGAFTSKRQARQRIESGAVRIDGEPLSDANHLLRAGAFPDRSFRFQAGKRCRFRIVLAAP